jgi:uncharacterized protein
MVEAADEAVVQTTQMLPVLRQAKVVDAGGLALALVLRGGLSAFTGDGLPDPDRLPSPSEETRRVIQEADFPRYCTEFLLSGARVERLHLQTGLEALGHSLETIWLEDAAPEIRVRVHIHTDDPPSVFAPAATLGSVSHCKVEDMQSQWSRFLSATGELLEISLVAVVSGQGLRRVFENLYGVGISVDNEPGARPGVEDMRAALTHVPTARVLLLPNDHRLLPVARKAVEGCGKQALVIPTRSMPQGIAAAMAFDDAASLEKNAHAMTEAAANVRIVVVTWAAEPPVAVGGGRVIAHHDQQLLARGDELVETAEAAVVALGCETGRLTIYYGAQASRAQADELAARLERRFPGTETEVIEGGQREWPLLIAVE